MNIAQLLSDTPGFLDGLSSAGFDSDSTSRFADEVSNQVAGDDGLDLSDILSSLNADSFLQKMDAGQIAQKIGLSEGMVAQGLKLIAPAIEQFAGKKLGVIGKLASSFLR